LLFAVLNSPSTEVYFPAYDGNANIMALCKGSDATWAAQYEYGPFGEVIRATGPMAKTNPFRFSNKYQDEETGLIYYGFRFYSYSMGRWLSRDPIEEKGGINLYGFVGNDPLNNVDNKGMASAWSWWMAAKWLLDPTASYQPTILPWSRFDFNGNSKTNLIDLWININKNTLIRFCKESDIGNSIIPSGRFLKVKNSYINTKDVWISKWDGTAFVSPLADGVKVSKDCKRCIFNYHLLMQAFDVCNFNPGENFGSLGLLSSDDTWIWVRDHTPFGHDYNIQSSTDASNEWVYEYN
jgi:RHS repeat-associated protein